MLDDCIMFVEQSFCVRTCARMFVSHFNCYLCLQRGRLQVIEVTCPTCLYCSWHDAYFILLIHSI